VAAVACALVGTHGGTKEHSEAFQAPCEICVLPINHRRTFSASISPVNLKFLVPLARYSSDPYSYFILRVSTYRAAAVNFKSLQYLPDLDFNHCSTFPLVDTLDHKPNSIRSRRVVLLSRNLPTLIPGSALLDAASQPPKPPVKLRAAPPQSSFLINLRLSYPVASRPPHLRRHPLLTWIPELPPLRAFGLHPLRQHGAWRSSISRHTL